MALETYGMLTAIGVIVMVAFGASIIFRRFRLPDILFLLGLGMLLGPGLNFVDVEGFRTMLPFVGTLAVIIILFDGGLDIKVKEIRTGVPTAMLMALLVFVFTPVLGGLVGYYVAGLSLSAAVLLGMIFAGAGVVIIVPLIQKMGVDPRATTAVTVEAVISDVIVILGVFGLAGAIALQQADGWGFAGSLGITFLIGFLLGSVLGLVWGRLLASQSDPSNWYIVTLAALFLLYAAAEVLGGSGPLAVLVFALVLGNTRTRERWAAHVPWAPTVPVFGDNLVNFHHEIVFFIRAFFFTALGASLDLAIFRDPWFLLVGFLLALAVVAARFLATFLVYGFLSLTAYDRLSIAVMFPLGLIAAVLSVVPHEIFGIPGTQDFPAYAAIVIVITNVLATAAVFTLSREGIRKRLGGTPRAHPPERRE